MMLLQSKLWGRRAEAPVQQLEQNLPGTGLVIVRIEGGRDINGKFLRKADQVVVKFGATDRLQERLAIVRKSDKGVVPELYDFPFINTSRREEDIASVIEVHRHYRWGGQKKVGEISFTPIVRDLLRQDGSVSATIAAKSYSVISRYIKIDIVVSFTFIPMTVDSLAHLGRSIPAPPGRGRDLVERRDDDTGNCLTNLAVYLTPAAMLISALATFISGVVG